MARDAAYTGSRCRRFNKPSFSEDRSAGRPGTRRAFKNSFTNLSHSTTRDHHFLTCSRAITALEPADEPDLLVAEPLVRTEIEIGCARVSTGGQKLERQIDALTAAGCRKIFADKKSGKNALRPELKACHAFLDLGDTLVVPSLDRYGRSLQDLINVEIGKLEAHR
ncbi:recombinase family protein [Streptomyces olivaceoviridis]|uniref:recombinase family protein n=1 Tax=Streptomyces olivaceoviridis TaxID=1921 RepID=UPI003D9ED948